MILRRAIPILALCAAGSGLAPGRQAPASSGLEPFLRSRLGLTARQIATVREGRPIAMALPAAVDREVQVGGAVHVDAPADRVAALLQDVERLESGEGFLKTRRISDPPRLEDFAEFELPPDDIAALRRCRPGNCDVKLGTGAFDLLSRIDWTSRDVAARVNDLARRTSLDYVNAYRKGGNAELAIYRDSDRPQFIAGEFEDLVTRAHVWTDMLRPLSDYLLGYPATTAPPRTQDFFYWSMAEFGLKPVFRLNHVVVYSTGLESGLQHVVAVKQLYASHYFHTALELRVVVADEGPAARGSTLVIVNMARSDGLTGLFGGIVKSKARTASRKGLESVLAAIKKRAEG